MPISTTIGTSAITRTGVCTSATRPTSPFVGQVVYESDTYRMMAYTGAGWAAVNIGAYTSSSRPTNPYQGQTIFETDTNRVTVWTGTVWRTTRVSTLVSRLVVQMQTQLIHLQQV